MTDPVGDVPFPQGDIIGTGFAETASTLQFGTKVKTPVNPATDQAWQDGLVFVGWAIDTNHDQSPEYIVFMFPDFAGGLVAELGGLTSGSVCDGTGKYVAGYGYTATFPRRCMPGGLRFQFQAAMSYTNDPNALQPPVDYAPDNSFSPTIVTAENAGASGYWMLGADGRVYPFGGAVGFPGVVPLATAMAPRKDGKGYWITDAGGNVRAYGTAASHGGSPVIMPGEYITTISATSTGKGYWLFSNLGRVFAFGDAPLFGDLSGTHLNGAIIASTATPSGKGYYMIGQDGGIFAFGDAKFHGSTGAMRLNKPIVGMSSTPKGDGYWLVGSDGGVFAFHAPFHGSLGAVHLNKPVDGLVAFGNGYLMAASDGGVFNFSNKAFSGSLGDHPPSAPIIGLAAFSG
ncbi:MAG TPA: hypothetical protein VGP92_03960 [Acidimicrobiia bacterium]|nr:hypothetical protein [Acidimicrobiia bacterium]